MNVRICNSEEMKSLLSDGYIDAHVVSIRDTDGSMSRTYSTLDRLGLNCAGLFTMYFDDVWSKGHIKYGYRLARPGQLASLFTWARDKDNFVVHCTGGISRSPAIAYLIACSKYGAEEGIKFIDPAIHYPNPFVVEMGAIVLGDPLVRTLWLNSFNTLDVNPNPCEGVRELKEVRDYRSNRS